MKSKFLLLFILLITTIYQVKSQTTISGIISTNTTLTLANSPYLVTGNILVPNGIVLNIEPGVIIKVNQGLLIRNEGIILANGNATNKIVFESSNSISTKNDWKGIRVRPSGGTIINTNQNYVSGSQFNHVIIKNAEIGIYVYNTGLFISNSEFNNNNIGVEVRATNGIVIKNSIFNYNNTGIWSEYEDYNSGDYVNSISNTHINDNLFTNNTFGIDLIMNQRDFINLNITNNIIKSNVTGIDFGGGGYGPRVHSVYISNNKIFNNSGIGVNLNRIYGIASNTTLLYPLEFTKNIVFDNKGGAIVFEYSPSVKFKIHKNILITKASNVSCIASIGAPSSSNHLFTQNYIMSNGKNLNLGGTNNYYSNNLNFTFNTIQNNSNENVINILYGSGHVFNYNNFMNINGMGYIINNQTINPINAENNYWGLNNISSIQSALYDYYDDFQFGIVDYAPYSSIPNIQAPISPPINFIKNKIGTDLVLTWNLNAEVDLAGYKLHYGDPTGYSYSNTINIGKVTRYTIPNGDINIEYAISAFDSFASGNDDMLNGNESWYAIATEKPVITSSSGSFLFCSGTQINLTTQSKPSYSYKWYKNGVNINSATSNTLTIDSEGIYKVVITENGQQFESDTVSLRFINVFKPTITTIGKDSACVGSVIPLEVDSVSNITLQWYKNDMLIPGATFKKYNVTTTGTYSVKVNNLISGCISSSLPKSIKIHPLPVSSIFYNQPTSFCVGDSLYLQRSTWQGNDVTYQWCKNGIPVTDSTRDTFYARESGSYTLITTKNACSSISSPVLVNVAAIPDVNIISNKLFSSTDTITVCVNDTVTLFGTNNPSYTYQWKLNNVNVLNATNPNINIFKSTPGFYSYSLEVKNNNACVKKSKTIVVKVTSLPSSTVIFPKTTFCIGDSVLLTGNQGSGLTYQWKFNGVNINGANNSTFYAKQTGAYTLEVTNLSGCKKLSVPVNMNTVNYPLNTLTAIGDTSVCVGTSVTLSVTPGTGVTYQWRRNNIVISGANSANYTTTTAGNYTVTITNTTGCAIISNPKTVIVNPLPISDILINGVNAVCSGDSIKLSSISRQVGYTYQWKRNNINILGAIDSFYYAKQSGNYTLLITDTLNCNNTSTSKSITIRSLPVVTLNNFNNTCYNSSPFMLSGGNPIGGAYSGVGVNNGIFNPSIAGIDTHIITYTYTDIYGCTNSVSKSIIVKPLPLNNITAAGPVTFCKGSSVDLSVASESNKTYSWYRNNSLLSINTNNITVKDTGKYYAIVNLNGCILNTDTITINHFEQPNVDIYAITDTTICQGSNSVLKTTTKTGWTYQWYNYNQLLTNETDTTIVVSTSGLYKVVVTNQFGCKDTSKSIYIDVLSYPIANITSIRNSTCLGDSIKISANIGSDLSYVWFKNGIAIPSLNNSFIYVKEPGQYSVNVIYKGLCISNSNSINITINPLPSSNITSMNGNQFCSGDTLILTGNLLPNVNYQWYLNNNILIADTNQIIKATLAGSYKLRIRDINNCEQYSDAYDVNYFDPPYSLEKICAISVDSLTGKNVVVWEKTPNVRTKKYNIYREGSATGQYDLIGSVNYNQMSTFIDNSATPLSQSYRYRISVVDSCDKESSQSTIHKTIHLSSNIGVNGEVNLAWSPYEGVQYLTHRILRSVNGGAFQTIAAVSGTTLSYTDLTAPAGPKYYRIEIDIPGGCDPTAMGYSTILSNPVAVSINSVQTDSYQASLINIYPNPTSGIVKIEGVIENNKVDIDIYDGLGKLLERVIIDKDGQFNLEKYAPGVYMFKIENKVHRVVKL